MADYRLSQSGDEVQSILTNSASRSLVEQEAERAAGAEQTLQQNIDAETLARQGADTTLQQNIDAETLARQGADTTLQQNIDAETLARQGADTTLQQNIDTEEARAKAAELAEKNRAEAAENAINAKIPASASAQNQLADKAFVNSSIATAAATFRGSYNLVSDMHLTVSATRLQIASALPDVIAEADNNDYCFVMIPTADATPTEIASIERYKYNGSAWAFEYALNNSGFTTAQWAALNSGITSGLVAKLTALPTEASLSTSLAALQQDIDDEETRAKGVEQTIAGNLSAEITRAQGAEGTLQGNIDAEALARQQADTALQNADTALGGRVTTIEGKIPVAASSSNQLADKDFVNSSIQTNTAEFKGSFNEVTDLNLTTSATRADIIAALPGVISSANNNDYCYVQIPTADATPTEIASVERYKYSGSAWAFEYALNNSGFTAAQWAALNSGINSGLVSKLSALPTNSELVTLLGGKQDVIADLSTIRSGAAAGSTAYQKPQTGIPSTDMSDAVQTSLGKADAAAPQSTTYTKTEVDGLVGTEETRAQAAEGGLQQDIDAIEAKIPVAASSSNQLADKDFVNSGIATATATFRGSYNLVSDLSLTTSATEQQIATALAGEISTADNNDYCFVQIPIADDTPTVIARVDRYKYNGTTLALEYTLNNSGFTAAQWDALNSGITSGLVTKLTALPTNAELTTLLNGKQDVIADLSTIRSGSSAGATAYQKPSSGIPSTDMTEAVQTSLGKADTALQEHQSLADYYTKQQTNAQINSAVATATATYRGSYNLVTDLGLTVGATASQIAAALAGEISTADNNDYCFVQVPVATDTPTVIGSVDRYKFDGTDWSFEYSLNNSGFTAAQWAALNSGINSGLVTKLTALPTNSELTTLLGGKQDVIADLAAIRLGAQAGATAYQKPATGIPDTDFTAELQAAIASFITKAVNDLTNYYLKSETYTKTEVDALVAAIQQFTLVSVQTLPTASSGTMNKIYLVPSSNPQTQNVKDEFITLMTDEQGTVTYSWECIGSTEVNLTNYYTKTQTDSAITAAINAALASYSTTSQVNSIISTALSTALASYITSSQADLLYKPIFNAATHTMIFPAADFSVQPSANNNQEEEPSNEEEPSGEEEQHGGES